MWDGSLFGLLVLPKGVSEFVGGLYRLGVPTSDLRDMGLSNRHWAPRSKAELALGNRALQSVDPEGRFKGRDTILSPATIPRPNEVGSRGFDLKGAALCTVEPAFRCFTPP
ncbi:hypothetical protein chiPu_0026638 [Chiloscyllium punctatum]|uniref:Uncharacterized protein n=1 Tax=Chiloscyllium punctatum TaxID=137246 RepID=A0A401TJ83_CHIPU|nr:hypothetical protein [Chiloscyllium punctatum]